ncbi:MAG: restriction endonuclease [Ktedonobacteraceae bacterium]
MSKAKKYFDHTASGSQSSVTKGRMIEAIVASMHEGENVKVERNVRLSSIGSQGSKREIDVLLTSEVCGYPVRWAFECKNEKKRIGAPYLDAFVGKLQDVGIPPQFGIFVAASDYSRGAIGRAKKEGIRLLIIKDVLADVESMVQHAIQTTVFLLPIIGDLHVQNFAFTSLLNFAEAGVLFNKQGKVMSTIPDTIWLAWTNGEIPASIGEHEIELEVTDDLYQRVGGELVRVTKIVVKLIIIGLVLQFTGTASMHHLHNATTKIIEREQLKASFDPLPDGKYQLKKVETEDQLEQEFRKPSVVALINRIRLPRINLWNVSYWPLSERVAKIVTERMQAFEAGRIPDPRPFNILELEGTDLSAIFEQISPLHPAGQMNL